jgi:hypothetical protein
MVILGSLPAREADDKRKEIDKAAMYLALEGVTKHGLAEAVKFILRGALGHTFFPSPPELRIQCDKAMEWPERERERIRRREQIERERPADRPEPTPDQRRRQQAAYQRFLASYDGGKQSAEEAERAEVRARYGMTPEVLDAMRDQPVPSNFKRLA